MRATLYTLTALILTALSACGEVDRYPVSGEECAPTDAVQTMAPPPCPEGMSGL